MSLSFVSSAVLSSTDGVSHNEEKEIENKEVDAVRSRQKSGNGQSLFQQLQANKEREEEERAEFQRSIMRGTLALDEEDCAHLDVIARQKEGQQRAIQKSTEDELALFRAAKADRAQSHIVVDENDEGAPVTEEKPVPSAAVAKKTTLAPKIIVKAKRKRKPGAGEPAPDSKSQPAPKRPTPDVNEKESKSGIGALLGGYGSSSDDDSD